MPGRSGLRRQVILQTASQWSGSSSSDITNTVTFGRTPSGIILAAGSTDAALGAYSASLSGYETCPYVVSGPNQNYGSSALWIARRSTGAVGTGMSFVGNSSWADAMAADVLGIKGEVLWSTHTWSGGGSSVALSAPAKGIRELGLLLVTGGRFKSGGAGGLSSSVSPAQPILAEPTGVLGAFSIYRYVPNSKPAVTWSFARGTNCSAWAVILR